MREKPLFDVKFSSTGTCVGKLRNEVTIKAIEPFQTVNTLATDEGKFQGGEGTAPTPLEFFLTGLVGCLMTQMRVFSRRMKIKVDDVVVTCDAHWEAYAGEGFPYEGQPVGFAVDIDVRSPEHETRILELVNASRKGCFVEQTIERKTRIDHRVRVNAQSWAEV